MAHHGKSWYILVHNGTLWYIMVHHGTLWHSMGHHSAVMYYNVLPASPFLSVGVVSWQRFNDPMVWTIVTTQGAPTMLDESSRNRMCYCETYTP